MVDCAEKEDFYIAVGVFAGRCGGASEPTLYEENFSLVKASCLDQAQVRARKLFEARAHGYRNQDGEKVEWALEELVDVAPLVDGTLVDGAELYARFFRDYTAYRRFEPALDGSVD